MIKMRPKTTERLLFKTTLASIFFLMLGNALFAQTSWYQKGREADNNHLKVEYFTRSIQEEGKNKFVYYLRGWAYYDLARYERSIKDFNTSINQEKGQLDDSYNYTGIAWCHYRNLENEKGISFAEKAISSMPNNAEAWNVKGWCFISQDKNKEAITAFSKFISIKPDVALGYSNRSYAFSQTEQFQKTIDDCNKALAIEAGNTLVLERKAYAMFKLGQKDAAIDLVKEQIGFKTGDDPRSVSIVGNLFYRNEDYAEAISYHTNAIGIYNAKVREDKDYRKVFRDDIYDIYMNRGECYYAKKDYQRALADFKKATTINPMDYEAFFRIGQLQTFQENWFEGAKGYERAFELKPELTSGWVNLGYCYDNLEQTPSVPIRVASKTILMKVCSTTTEAMVTCS